MADSNSSFDAKIIEGVAIGNLKSIAEQPAMLSNLAYSNMVANTNLAQQNAVANQQALNELGVAVTGKTIQLLQNLGPLEAVSTTELFTGNMLAQMIAELKASVASINTNQ